MGKRNICHVVCGKGCPYRGLEHGVKRKGCLNAFCQKQDISNFPKGRISARQLSHDLLDRRDRGFIAIAIEVSPMNSDNLISVKDRDSHDRPGLLAFSMPMG